MNVPIFDVIDPKTKLQIDIRDLIEEQLKISEMQSKTADKQYKGSIFLTITAIIINLVPVVTELIIDNPKSSKSIILLTESQSKLTKEVLNMSNYLIEIQKKQNELEKENEILKQKLKTKKR
jgi:hypothetical protein